MLTVPGTVPSPRGQDDSQGSALRTLPYGNSAVSVHSARSNTSAASGLVVKTADGLAVPKHRENKIASKNRLDAPGGRKKDASNFASNISTAGLIASDLSKGVTGFREERANELRKASKCSGMPPQHIRDAEMDKENKAVSSSVEEAVSKGDASTVPGLSGKVPVRRGSFVEMMQEPSRTNTSRLEILKWQARKILTSQRFDWAIGMIIFVNSLTIGIQSTWELMERDVSVFEIMEHFYMVIYLGELMLRFFAFGKTCLRSGWVIFDVFLVSVGVVQGWIVEPIVNTLVSESTDAKDGLDALMVLRVMRLLRLARSVRLLVQFKTLWMLVRGLLSSASTMIYTFVLIMIILYVFSCLGLELITKNPELRNHEELSELVGDYFSGIAVTMLTLFRLVTLDNAAEIYAPMIMHSPLILGCYFFVFIIVVSVSLMNLVTAVIVEGAIEQGKQDREVQKAYEKQKVSQLIPTIRRLFEELDTDGSGGVSLAEVTDADECVQEELQKIMQTDQIVVLFELLDTDGSGDISIEEFCDGIAKMVTSEEPMEFIRIRKQMQQNREGTEEMADKVMDLDSSLGQVKDTLSNAKQMAADFVIEQGDELHSLENVVKQIRNSIQHLTTSIVEVQRSSQDLAAQQNTRVVHLEKASRRMDATLDEMAYHILGRPPLSGLTPGSDPVSPRLPDAASGSLSVSASATALFLPNEDMEDAPNDSGQHVSGTLSVSASALLLPEIGGDSDDAHNEEALGQPASPCTGTLSVSASALLLPELGMDEASTDAVIPPPPDALDDIPLPPDALDDIPLPPDSMPIDDIPLPPDDAPDAGFHVPPEKNAVEETNIDVPLVAASLDEDAIRGPSDVVPVSPEDAPGEIHGEAHD